MPSKDHVDFYYVRFSARADLNGQDVDVAGFSINYALDMIPTAEIYPTVGREPVNNKEARAVEALLEAQPFTPVKIYAKFETEKDNPGDDPGFPYDEDVLLFDGYITGITYQSTRNPAGGAVSLVAGAMGWLAGLRGTTTQSTTATVKGPGGFKELLNLYNTKITYFNIKMPFALDGSGIVTDLWKRFVKPFFTTLVDSPSVWGDAPNDSASSALSRMDKDAFASTNAQLPFQITVKGDIGIDFAKEYVGQSIGRAIYGVWRKGDLWQALQWVANEFKFSVVPLIETASCVPVYGALNGKPHRYITTNDYNDIRLDVMTPMKIVKVAVVGSTITSGWSPTPITSAVLGLHSAEEAWNDPELGARGHTITVPAPAWLEGLVPIGKVSRDSLGGENLLIPDASNPSANATEPADDYQEIYSNYVKSEIGDLYAKTIAQHLLFAERRGTVTGRFRLDISPGSLVKVQVINDKFAEEGAEEKALYGLVMQVGLEVRAGAEGGSGRASTSFSLGFVRTAAEHEGKGDALTASAHPLYDRRFVGAKLWSG